VAVGERTTAVRNREGAVAAREETATRRDIRKGLEAGFFRYLTKSIKVNEFMGTLRAALECADHGLGLAHDAGRRRWSVHPRFLTPAS
jgi:DNA-binding response OmpR family regulator